MMSSAAFFQPIQKVESESKPIVIKPSDVKQVLDKYYSIKTISCTHPKSPFITELEVFLQSLTADKPLTYHQLYGLSNILKSINIYKHQSPKAFEASEQLEIKTYPLIDYTYHSLEIFTLIAQRPELGKFIGPIENTCYGYIISHQNIGLYDEVFLERELRQIIREKVASLALKHPDALVNIATNTPFTPIVIFTPAICDKLHGNYQFLMPVCRVVSFLGDELKKTNKKLSEETINFICEHAEHATSLLTQLQLAGNLQITEALTRALLDQLPPPSYESSCYRKGY